MITIKMSCSKNRPPLSQNQISFFREQQLTAVHLTLTRQNNEFTCKALYHSVLSDTFYNKARKKHRYHLCNIVKMTYTLCKE